MSKSDNLDGVRERAEYRDGLAQAGFIQGTVTPTHQVTDGLHSAIIQAIKP
ncbi:MAG: hypothetical protein JO016_12120 [Actinobacteria bacterium]|nr:hypothetical protein [Actinomycetota bacterium]